MKAPNTMHYKACVTNWTKWGRKLIKRLGAVRTSALSTEVERPPICQCIIYRFRASFITLTMMTVIIYIETLLPLHVLRWNHLTLLRWHYAYLLVFQNWRQIQLLFQLLRIFESITNHHLMDLECCKTVSFRTDLEEWARSGMKGQLKGIHEVLPIGSISSDKSRSRRLCNGGITKLLHAQYGKKRGKKLHTLTVFVTRTFSQNMRTRICHHAESKKSTRFLDWKNSRRQVIIMSKSWSSGDKNSLMVSIWRENDGCFKPNMSSRNVISTSKFDI